VKGWTEKELVLIASLMFNTSSGGSEGSEGPGNVVMALSYHLGSRPEMEMRVRNFFCLQSTFKERTFEQARLWIETLFLQVCPLLPAHHRQVPTREDVCTHFFKSILMSARFRWSFGPVFDGLNEVVMQMPGVQRENFLRANWKA